MGVKRFKLTTIILVVLTLIIVGYIACSRGSLLVLIQGGTILEEKNEIFALNINENETVVMNDKQIVKVNKDGIVAYDLDGYEIWQDTHSVSNFTVKQREPYLAVGSKKGKTIYLYNNKGKQAEISCENPILYFSVNENGGIAIVEELSDGHMVSAYNKQGKYLGGLVTYMEQEGYPTTAELSPDESLLLASYVNANEPTLTSTIRGIATKIGGGSEVGVKYGLTEKDNFIYEMEFIAEDTWVSVGDKSITWYDQLGNVKASKTGLTPLYTPYISKINSYGQGFLPILSAESTNKNIIHRVDTLDYFNSAGEIYFTTTLNQAADYFYADSKGVIVGQGNDFKGYNKMGNLMFDYHSSADVTKLFYLPESGKGVAVTKESVILLKAKRKVGK